MTTDNQSPRAGDGNAQPDGWLVYLPSEQRQEFYESQDDAGYVDDVTNHDDAVVAPYYRAAPAGGAWARAKVLEEAARQCDAVKAEFERMAQGANTGMYDHQAQGAESCAEAIRTFAAVVTEPAGLEAENKALRAQVAALSHEAWVWSKALEAVTSRQQPRNIIALPPLPQPSSRERVYVGHGNEEVAEYFSGHLMLDYARQAVFEAEEAWQARAAAPATADGSGS